MSRIAGVLVTHHKAVKTWKPSGSQPWKYTGALMFHMWWASSSPQSQWNKHDNAKLPGKNFYGWGEFTIAMLDYKQVLCINHVWFLLLLLTPQIILTECPCGGSFCNRSEMVYLHCFCFKTPSIQSGWVIDTYSTINTTSTRLMVSEGNPTKNHQRF